MPWISSCAGALHPPVRDFHRGPRSSGGRFIFLLFTFIPACPNDLRISRPPSRLSIGHLNPSPSAQPNPTNRSPLSIYRNGMLRPIGWVDVHDDDRQLIRGEIAVSDHLIVDKAARTLTDWLAQAVRP